MSPYWILWIARCVMAACSGRTRASTTHARKRLLHWRQVKVCEMHALINDAKCARHWISRMERTRACSTCTCSIHVESGTCTRSRNSASSMDTTQINHPGHHLWRWSDERAIGPLRSVQRPCQASKKTRFNLHFSAYHFIASVPYVFLYKIPWHDPVRVFFKWQVAM